MKIINKHITQISAGDTVIHEGVERTVNKNDIGKGGHWGFSFRTLFGDSYKIGTLPVQVVVH